MIRAVHFFEKRTVYVRVNLGSQDGDMAQHFLYCPEIRTALKQMSRK